ncbi:ABC transporter ATP-binding protein [Rhodococcus sp. WS1]|uniref:ABC transporter ATP-binding protein n=1 Tax=Rhodococcus TaxID=1827 RepID=UPI001141C914|nr:MULTISPECIES: ABC transporter ATP-binding protein [Rhodococcus]QSE41006.1 ABC transporter ATP-binding protein [Rhodococcus erythropolis]ROZ55460.1 ABC transporter ATP-binding protein [Rhodococcus sp. WS1]TQC39763.1 ABC transporter ATP-binding protein [Rhodococcus sp. WS7]
MTTATPVSRLQAEKIELRYADRTIVDELSLEIPDGGFTVVVGPNGCGKSTLLRALGRMLAPRSGRVLLDGNDIRSYRTKEVARRIALLPQSPLSPGAITVADLVARGRYPYQSMLRQWSPEDERVVAEALAEVGMRNAADQLVDELSGGQRQRVWIAMTLAQRTPVLLLDEPTTFLDIAHQIEVLDLCSQLHQSGRTLVAVLHDLNLAARYATHVVAMRSGKIVMQGSASDVFTPELLREVFDLEALVLEDPETGRPLVVPRDRRPASQLPVHN